MEGFVTNQNILKKSSQVKQQPGFKPRSNASINVTENYVKIKLQAMLDQTVNRLTKLIKPKKIGSELCLTSKWGYDIGSQQSIDNQTLENGSDDTSGLMCSFVPSKLTCGDKFIWENPKPSSPLYCRPIFLQFFDTSDPTVMEAKDAIEAEIADLKPSVTENNVIVKHKMSMIMIDGEIMSDKSNESCDICKTVPAEMNDLGKVTKMPISSNILQYGISTTGVWIKVLECMLQIAYRLEFKTWQVEGENEVIMNDRKKAIQERFREEIDLLVDRVKEGSGTRNDRTTARRFFANRELTTSVTGLDKNVLERFATILRVITSGENINVDNFSSYALETAELYVKLYSWYPMPTSVHKLLIHGPDIIKNCNVIPIGHHLHEALRYRDRFSYRFNRIVKNERLFKKFLVESDPYLSSMRLTEKLMTEDMKALFILSSKDEEYVEIIDVDDMGMMNSDYEEDSDDSDCGSD